MDPQPETPVSRRQFLRIAGGLAAAGLLPAAQAAAPAPALPPANPGRSPSRRNVLLIHVDDLGPEVNSIIQNGPVPTPNLESLARSGAGFSLCYCPAPACCPARTAVLTGVSPSRSGVYYNNQAYRRTKRWISRVRNLPQHFQDHGYLTAGYGKIFHNRYQEDDQDSWTNGYGEPFSNEREALLEKQALSVRRGYPYFPFGPLPDDWDRDDPAKMQQDTAHANKAIQFLQDRHDQPFFLACGLFRPHVGLFVAKRYFDRFPLEKIELPPGYRPDDLDDVPKCARWLATHRHELADMIKAGVWKNFLQAYYAAITYADEQIGRVVQALEASPYRDNTVVVFTSDHGWHTGEKSHLSKFALWDIAARIPFSIRVPGLVPHTIDTPVSSLDLYPTLLRLCDLPDPAHRLDGSDLGPLLRRESAGLNRPALSTYGPNNHAVRNQRFYYIRYQNGAEELYDMVHDRYQWQNLAGDPRYDSDKAELRRWLPPVCADEIEASGTDNIDRWQPEAFL